MLNKKNAFQTSEYKFGIGTIRVDSFGNILISLNSRCNLMF